MDDENEAVSGENKTSVASRDGSWEIIKTIFYAILIALFVRVVAYEPFKIPSGSMIPTLQVGDYMFVSKFSYGYSRFSLPFSLPLFHGRIFYTPPKRGDVVVFKLPTNTDINYVKRIIGLPGDRIQMINGILNINGVPVKRKRVQDYTYTDERSGTLVRETQYIETLPNGVKHPILEISDNLPQDNTQVYTVPPGHFFAMGDNRDNSEDSRFLNVVGFIPKENLVGHAEFLFFSFNGDAWDLGKWGSVIRFSRIFSVVH
ncbi:signal peptidase I [Varunaivibrio sulfuroxidans]|uniref:Signal peptidase I n=1 Tax=Varunaivibrio sulfuroxidans TaxID=1773489 RepID=A0A4R3JDW5_9PROT|nr:signal peptidase I [Varunaivibrio sulfuroxidans]TCS64228.1 signal peptidase I [Varunaivibrio sulfuroxidans]WES31331.1 signal peptidase I [Varunaivibrio sulfuroxidans]